MYPSSKKSRTFILLLLVSAFVVSLVTQLSRLIIFEFPQQNTVIDFSKADNITGFPYDIVPNIIHYIKFRSDQLDFVEMVCMLSAVRNHGPDELIVHSDKGQMQGKYWDMLLEHSKGSRTKIRVRKYEEPTHIFGIKFGYVQHASDVARLRILMEHGGIYLDTDEFVVNSLRPFLHFEYALAWDEGQFLGTQIQIAHKNARFLKLYLDTYRQYNPKLWYYNAGELPTKSVLMKNPSLVHRVKLLFGADTSMAAQLYTKNWPEWKKQFTMHLFKRWRIIEKNSPFTIFDEQNIKIYNFTFGQMARQLLYNTTDLIK